MMSLLIFVGCDENRAVNRYIKSNYSAIDLEDDTDFSGLTIMDSDLEGKKIFLTGEAHGVAVNHELDLKFLKYFKDRAGVKYYLAETSYSSAHFINKYLNTGDEKYLEDTYRQLKGTNTWSKNSYNFWKELYDYNQTLPNEEKIQVVGVDIEHQKINAYRFFLDVLPDQEPPEEIQEKIYNIKNIYSSIETMGSSQILRSSEELKRDMEDNKSIYQEYLGEDFIGFNLVNTNLINSARAYSVGQNYVRWNDTRDRMMYENFRIIHDQLPEGKYYGQWGSEHIYQSKMNDIMWFAAHLNSEGSEFQNKILSILYQYDECERMSISPTGSYSATQINFYSGQFKRINDEVGGDLNIYKLTGEDSPFLELPMSNSRTGEMLEEAILDFYQYRVFIKNSPATEPLGVE